MQVLEILPTGEHRVVGHERAEHPPQGMREWEGPFPPHLPFERVWASERLQPATVHEIVNGYCPAPGDWPTDTSPLDDS